MKYCEKCEQKITRHSYIVDDVAYCSPGCQRDDKHTGWIARLYHDLDKTGKSTRKCRGWRCCSGGRRYSRNLS